MSENESKKLSELMRAGAALRPQGFDRYYSKQKGVWHSCALGAAYEAFTGKAGYPANKLLTPDDILAEMGLKQGMADHPGYLNVRGWVTDIVVSLNDHYHWERERIADWLESIGY